MSVRTGRVGTTRSLVGVAVSDAWKPQLLHRSPGDFLKTVLLLAESALGKRRPSLNVKIEWVTDRIHSV